MRIAIISGGSSGIGKACVKKFLKEGYYVYNFDIVQNNELDSCDNYTWLMTDVRNRDAILNSIAKVVNEKNKIDALIACAGKHLSANVENTSEAQLLDLINLNMLGVFWLIQGAIVPMKKNNQGKIIVIGSDQCVIAKQNSAVYGMTKAAILSLTKNIALDYAPYNIRANCIGAGTIDTPLYRNAINKYSKKSGIPLEIIEKEEGECQPIGRIGKASEVAALAFFLSRDEADFITGGFFPIDGGYTAR